MSTKEGQVEFARLGLTWGSFVLDCFRISGDLPLWRSGGASLKCVCSLGNLKVGKPAQEELSTGMVGTP